VHDARISQALAESQTLQWASPQLHTTVARTAVVFLRHFEQESENVKSVPVHPYRSLAVGLGVLAAYGALLVHGSFALASGAVVLALLLIRVLGVRVARPAAALTYCGGS